MIRSVGAEGGKGAQIVGQRVDLYSGLWQEGIPNVQLQPKLPRDVKEAERAAAKPRRAAILQEEAGVEAAEISKAAAGSCLPCS